MADSSKNLDRMRNHAAEIFRAGISAVEPFACVKENLRLEENVLEVAGRQYDLDSFRNIYVTGAGKASAPMGKALEEILGERITAGIINVKYGHTAELGKIRLVEAGHPVPDANGEQGAAEIMELVKEAGEKDLVICLLSGGGSALLPLSADGITLSDKQETARLLLAAGATIHEINAVRKHTSAIKGGRLAAAARPATVLSLILSDVVGDDLDVIASGPTVPDSSSFRDCISVIEKYRIGQKLPESVVDRLISGASGLVEETPKPGEGIFDSAENLIIGSNIAAVTAARKMGGKLGYNTVVLSSMIEGDTGQAAKFHAALAKEVLNSGNPVPRPACILSGGETTVEIRGKGLGGRNQEFSLVAAMEIAGAGVVLVLCAGTDGNDGPTDAAGAFADSQTVERAAGAGLDPGAYLADNDSYHFFDQLGDLFKPGPTNTNVMDMRIMLIP